MKILHLEDNPHDAELVRELLVDQWPDCEVRTVADEPAYVAALNTTAYDLIVSDFTLVHFDGATALQLARDRAPDTPFIFVSGTIGEDRAIEAVHAGAADYVLKDRMKRLTTAIQRALRESDDRRSRRRAEAALVESNERFQLVARATNDVIWDWNLTDDHLWWSAGYETLFGHQRRETRPDINSWTEHIHPEDRSRVQTTIHHAINHQTETWQEEYRFRRANGTYASVLDRGFILRDRAGKAYRMIGSMLDLTAHKEAQTLIREQADLLNQARDAIIVVDAAHCVTFWNSGAERLLGWSATEAIGQTVEKMLGVVGSGLLNEIRQNTSEKSSWRGEIRASNKAGAPIVMEAHSTAIMDESGHIKGRFHIITDVTEKKQLQEQLLRIQRLESIGMLASGIAHDFNNVLTPILMAAPMLRRNVTDPLDVRLLETLEHSAERGANLVRQILSFAHGTVGEPTLLQVKHLARDIVEMIEGTFPKAIKLEQHFPANLWTIRANPTQMHQVLLNLCVNARDAMPTGGTLRLLAANRHLDEKDVAGILGARAGDFVVIEVRDTGTGIPLAVLQHIWEPFFTTKGEGKGTGLGLPTVRGIVENHNGFIELQTAAGRGTSFRVYLPAAETALAEANPGSASPFLPRGHGELILLVEDEPTNREVAQITLARHGYRVLVASSGAEAVALFVPRSAEIRLVISDLNMPNLNGDALAALLERLKPGIRILSISGMNRRSGKNEAAFLSKPFKPEALLHKVHALLQNGPPA